MKFVSYAFAFLLLALGASYSQTNICLFFPLEPGKSWTYVCDERADSLTSEITDTITVNNKRYYIFAPYGRGPYDNWQRYPIRPEDKRIYALNTADSTEYLFFDFDAEPGVKWDIPPVPSPPSNQPVNQCDWGSAISLVSNDETVMDGNRTFYHCRRFAHWDHPCYDAGIGNTIFARDFGIVRFSQVTEGGVLDWRLVTDPADTAGIPATYAQIGNPCLTIPCLPGIVSAISVNDTNYILTIQDNFFWNGEFSWNDYIPLPGDSVLAKGILTNRTDLLKCQYYTLEVLDFQRMTSTGLKDPVSGQIGTKDILFQNYPNPFNPRTKVKYLLNKPGMVSIFIYDVMGRRIKTIVNEYQNSGSHSIIVDAGDMPSGNYYYQLVTNNSIQTKLMIVTK